MFPDEAGGLNSRGANATELLHWWHRHQTQALHQEADRIRNGLLQDLAAMRRQLELACLQQPQAEAFGCDLHLAELQRLYAVAENLSDRLESPYLRDSLPLALRHGLETWQPGLDLQLDLPAQWQPDPPEQTWLMLTLVQELASQLQRHALLEMRLTLTQSPSDKAIAIEASCRERPADAPQVLAAVEPMLQTFQLLWQGRYQVQARSSSTLWELRWPIVPTAIPDSPVVPEVSP